MSIRQDMVTTTTDTHDTCRLIAWRWNGYVMPMRHKAASLSQQRSSNYSSIPVIIHTFF